MFFNSFSFPDVAFYLFLPYEIRSNRILIAFQCQEASEYSERLGHLAKAHFEIKIKVSNKWYNHSYDNSGNDNNGIHNSSFDTTFEYNHIFFLSKSLILPVVVNIRDVNVPCSMSRILGSLCRCMTNPPRLQIMALSNVHTYLHTLVGTWREYHRLASHIVVWQHYRTPV